MRNTIKALNAAYKLPDFNIVNILWKEKKSATLFIGLINIIDFNQNCNDLHIKEAHKVVRPEAGKVEEQKLYRMKSQKRGRKESSKRKIVKLESYKRTIHNC